MTDAPRPRSGGGWAGFLAMAFALVGLIGVFATYAAPLPLERAMHREDVLDQLLRTPAADRPALRDALGDSADAVLASTGDLTARVAAERVAMRARFAAEEAFTQTRLRGLILVLTILGAGIGWVVLGMRRS